MDHYEYIRLIRSSNLTSKARITALIIASYYNWSTADPAFPSNKVIAKGAGLSERSVRNAKQELVAAGYLRQTRHMNTANTYVPTAPVAAVGGTSCQLNNNINNNTNNKLNNNNKFSNENLYEDLKTKNSKEDIQLEEYRQSDNPSLAKFKEMAAWEW